MRGALVATPPGSSARLASSAPAPAELDALFDVVGTPSWADIDAVPSAAWRSHLRSLHCRAQRLTRRLGAAGEVALSLLGRLLAFDPTRRASPAEALAHEYFFGGLGMGVVPPRAPTPPPPVPAPVDAAPDAPLRHYYDEPDPFRALAVLEEEADRVCGCVASAGDPPLLPGGGACQLDSARRGDAGVAALRELLEAECESLRRAREQQGAAGAPGAPPAAAAAALAPDATTARPPRPPPTVDTAVDAQAAARGRLAHAPSPALHPAAFLQPGRHGEWTGTGDPARPRAGPAWGVAVLPPGVDADDERVADAVRRQQAR